MMRRVALTTVAIIGALLAWLEAVHGWVNEVVPPPPVWLAEFSVWFIREIAPYFYWLAAIVSGSVWIVLRWQRRKDESSPATWFRHFILAKWLLWASLAMGRLFLDWREVAWVISAIVVILVGIKLLIEMTRTYVIPALKFKHNVRQLTRISPLPEEKTP